MKKIGSSSLKNYDYLNPPFTLEGESQIRTFIYRSMGGEITGLIDILKKRGYYHISVQIPRINYEREQNIIAAKKLMMVLIKLEIPFTTHKEKHIITIIDEKGKRPNVQDLIIEFKIKEDVAKAIGRLT